MNQIRIVQVMVTVTAQASENGRIKNQFVLPAVPVMAADWGERGLPKFVVDKKNEAGQVIDGHVEWLTMEELEDLVADQLDQQAEKEPSPQSFDI